MASSKIFVGGLSWYTTKESLQQYFSNYGEVTECTLKTNPTTGKSRGFGFVEFADASTVSQVLGQKHTVDGKVIDAKEAEPKPGPEPILKVFVGGLDSSIPEDDVRRHFEQFGVVEDIEWPFDSIKGQKKGFCFVKFKSEDIVETVIATEKQMIGSSEVDVKKATPKGNNFGGKFGGEFGGNYGSGFGRSGGFSGGRGGRGRGGQRGGRGFRSGGGSYSGNGYGSGYSDGYQNYNNTYSGGYGNGYQSAADYSSGYADDSYGSNSYSGYSNGTQWGGQQNTQSRNYHPYQR